MAGGEVLESAAGDELLRTATEEGLDLRAALDGDDASLRPTDVAQPALLFVEAVLGLSLPQDLHVVAVAGHSVGEYAACVAAGALRPADAMRVVIARGRAMAAMHEGTMSALLGLGAAAAEEVCAEASPEGIVVVANINAPEQTVISGTTAGVEAAERLALERGAKRAVRLNVSGAFHSPLMADAAEQVAAVLDAVEVSRARVPVVANVDAAAVTEPDEIRDRLRRQITAPVRWVECVRRLVDLGAGDLVEVGPGSVLSGLARRIAPEARTQQVSSPQAARTFTEVAAQ
ncbi:MAG: acyltransferase domain-containing protein [Candidatus Dormibacteraeota bacterium]|nr:acyltransferase domain-containing protein [Candidatus Dormibacteraeota bacterium]